MSFDIENIEEITLIQVKESKIYLELSELFKQTLLDLINQGKINLIIDLSMVNVINSSGLGALFLALYKVKDRGGDLKIVGLTPLVEEIFDRMKLNLIYGLFGSKEDAINSFQSYLKS